MSEDGIHVRQSDISTFMNCPEQARLKMLTRPDEHYETDAAVVGSTIHALIEHELQDGPEKYLKDAQGWAAHWFLQQLESFAADPLCVYSTETFGTNIKALRAIEQLAESWWFSDDRATLLMYSLDELNIEWNFDKRFLDATNDRPAIWLAGTSDLVFANRVWDWKSTSGMRNYARWEKQRWAAQPTVYTWAAADEGLIKPDKDGLYRFEYKVFVRGKIVSPETVTVWRSPGHFAWLERIVTGMVDMYLKMGLDTPWPVNDEGALCSPKWCPFWDSCKGARISAVEWV